VIRARPDAAAVAAAVVFAAGLGVAALAVWLRAGPRVPVEIRVPGLDGRAEKMAAAAASAAAAEPPIVIGELFERLADAEPRAGSPWPMFRGPRGDNVADSTMSLLGGRPDDPLVERWSVELGEGYAGPAIFAGRVYLLDYDEARRADLLRCWTLEDGRELWRRGYRVHIKRNHGMSRTVPAVTDRFVVTIGPRAHVMAADPVSGEFLWGLDLERDYGAQVPPWYTGQCPLLDGDAVILAPAGPDALLMAVDGRTGAIRWRAPNPRGWRMSHASVLAAALAGRRQFVYAAAGGVAGVAADGPDAGALLWETAEWAPSVVAPSPIALDGERVLLTAGYAAGGAVLRVARDGDRFDARIVERYGPTEGLSSEQHTPILRDGYLFAILTKDAGPLRNQFAAYRADDLREPVWTSGRAARFGLGPYLLADGKFYVLNDDGTLVVARARADAYEELSRRRVLAGREAWAPPAFSDGRLLLRDSRRMICLDLRAPEATP